MYWVPMGCDWASLKGERGHDGNSATPNTPKKQKSYTVSYHVCVFFILVYFWVNSFIGLGEGIWRGGGEWDGGRRGGGGDA